MCFDHMERRRLTLQASELWTLFIKGGLSEKMSPSSHLAAETDQRYTTLTSLRDPSRRPLESFIGRAPSPQTLMRKILNLYCEAAVADF